MTIDEILTCEIPKGEHNRVLYVMRDRIQQLIKLTFVKSDVVDDWRKSFVALYEVTKGRYMPCTKWTEAMIKGVNQGTAEGYAKALDDALAVVDELKKDIQFPWYTPTYAETRRRIEALGEKV